MKYGLHGHLLARPGQGKALADMLLRASELMETAPGCRFYLVSQDSETPEEVWITEVWDSEEQHDKSLNLPGVRDLISQAMPLLAKPPQGGQKLRVLGGRGL